jgi:hypothetical protein
MFGASDWDGGTYNDCDFDSVALMASIGRSAASDVAVRFVILIGGVFNAPRKVQRLTCNISLGVMCRRTLLAAKREAHRSTSESRGVVGGVWNERVLLGENGAQ